MYVTRKTLLTLKLEMFSLQTFTIYHTFFGEWLDSSFMISIDDQISVKAGFHVLIFT